MTNALFKIKNLGRMGAGSAPSRSEIRMIVTRREGVLRS